MLMFLQLAVLVNIVINYFIYKVRYVCGDNEFFKKIFFYMISVFVVIYVFVFYFMGFGLKNFEGFFYGILF